MATVTQIGPRLGIAPTCAALGLPRATYYRRRRPPRAAPPRRPSPRALSAGGARRGARAVARAALRGSGPGRGLRHAARRGHVSLLRAHDVSPPGRARRGAGAARSAPASRLCRPGAAGPPAQRAVELGHHQAARARRSGPTSTCTSCSTSSAATSSAGWWPIARAPRWPSGSSARRAPGRASAASSSRSTPTAGSAMTSKPVALLLADLGVTKTHSRPHVSNDNPFSEAQFKTLKYRPEFPERFGSIQDARAHCHVFFPWYNTEHHHSGLGLLTPARRAPRPGRAARGGAGDRARHGLCRASRALPRRAPPAAGAPHGGLDQPTPQPGPLARIIEYPAAPTCPRGHLRVACPRSLRSRNACERQGEADASGGKAREGEGRSQAPASPASRRRTKPPGVRDLEKRLAESLEREARRR